MSFTFKVAGHAGQGVEPTDEDEGERVKRFAAAVLEAGAGEGLDVTVQEFSPPRWSPDETHRSPQQVS